MVVFPRVSQALSVPSRGQSSSSLELDREKGYATYTGSLVVEGGGFCGTRASGGDASVDLSGFDGVTLRVRGDGHRYKLNLKTTETLASENVYQAAFDTLPLQDVGEGAGGWQTITIPFHRFYPVVRNRVDYKAAPLQPSSQAAVSLGLVYSRFEFNRQANPYYDPGAFSLSLEEIALYRSRRPSLVLVSSAGAERNAKVETEEDRKTVRKSELRHEIGFVRPLFPLLVLPLPCPAGLISNGAPPPGCGCVYLCKDTLCGTTCRPAELTSLVFFSFLWMPPRKSPL